MVILVELFLFLIRYILLQTVALATYVLGGDVYKVLAVAQSPCVELLSFFIGTIPVIFLVFGAMHRRYFWQRPGYFNWIVVVVSLAISFAATFLPGKYLSMADASLVACQPPVGDFHVYSQFLFTGLIVALLAFVGMDIGVALKHVSHHMQSKKALSTAKSLSSKTKKRTKKKK